MNTRTCLGLMEHLLSICDFNSLMQHMCELFLEDGETRNPFVETKILNEIQQRFFLSWCGLAQDKKYPAVNLFPFLKKISNTESEIRVRVEIVFQTKTVQIDDLREWCSNGNDSLFLFEMSMYIVRNGVLFITDEFSEMELEILLASVLRNVPAFDLNFKTKAEIFEDILEKIHDGSEAQKDEQHDTNVKDVGSTPS